MSLRPTGACSGQAAQRDPSEVVIDTIPRYDPQHALIRGRMPLDLFGQEEDEGLSGIAGAGIEPALGERRNLRMVGWRQLTRIRCWLVAGSRAAARADLPELRLRRLWVRRRNQE